MKFVFQAQPQPFLQLSEIKWSIRGFVLSHVSGSDNPTQSVRPLTRILLIIPDISWLHSTMLLLLTVTLGAEDIFLFIGVLPAILTSWLQTKSGAGAKTFLLEIKLKVNSCFCFSPHKNCCAYFVVVAKINKYISSLNKIIFDWHRDFSIKLSKPFKRKELKCCWADDCKYSDT